MRGSQVGPETIVRKIEHPAFTDLVFASGRSLRLSKFLASFVEPEDEVRFSLPVESNGFNSPELLIRSSSGRCLYQAVIGYAARPRTDRQAHPYIQAEIPYARLGFACLHLPCAAVRDYFYRPKRNSCDGTTASMNFSKLDPSLPWETFASLTACGTLSSWQTMPPRPPTSALTRAMNLLAVPELRACHDALLADPKTPALFPFAGFGLILVAGTPSDGRFFVRRILSFIPTVKRRHLAVPLRKLNYLPDRAVYRDSRLKLEVTFDPFCCPSAFSPSGTAGSISPPPRWNFGPSL